MEKVVIIGAGSWGTALGLVLARKKYDVTLWEFNQERAEEIQRERENKRFLPGVKFPDNLKVTNKREGLLDGIKYVVFSVPSQVLRNVIGSFSNDITEDMLLVNTAKGIEVSTGMRLSEVMKDEIKGKFHKNIVILSGPTHAEEVAIGIPTTIVAAGKKENAAKIQELFNSKNFRVYLNEDTVGVEIGAAVKNCLAIGAGRMTSSTRWNTIHTAMSMPRIYVMFTWPIIRKLSRMNISESRQIATITCLTLSPHLSSL